MGKPSATVTGEPYVRAIVHDQPGKTIVHLFNLNVRRLSSFEDKVSPANDVRLVVRVPFTQVRGVRVETADTNATAGPVEFTTSEEEGKTLVNVTIPQLEINSLVEIEASHGD
jgi:hypothetical protein